MELVGGYYWARPRPGGGCHSHGGSSPTSRWNVPLDVCARLCGIGVWCKAFEHSRLNKYTLCKSYSSDVTRATPLFAAECYIKMAMPAPQVQLTPPPPPPPPPPQIMGLYWLSPHPPPPAATTLHGLPPPPPPAVGGAYPAILWWMHLPPPSPPVAARARLEAAKAARAARASLPVRERASLTTVLLSPSRTLHPSSPPLLLVRWSAAPP